MDVRRKDCVKDFPVKNGSLVPISAMQGKIKGEDCLFSRTHPMQFFHTESYGVPGHRRDAAEAG